jgi:hypothetical protein
MAVCAMTGLNRAGYYRSRLRQQDIPVEMELRDEVQCIANAMAWLWSSACYRRVARRNVVVNHKHVLWLHARGQSALHSAPLVRRDH